MDSSEDERRSLIARTIEVVLGPVRPLLSKHAQRTYLRTALFSFASLSLICVSVIAYIIFYRNFVPQIAIERPIYLQFDDGAHPYGFAHLGMDISSLQPYDVSVILLVPRTPENQAAGNFMLELSLLAPTTSDAIKRTSLDVLARSRRPAILSYASPLVETASAISQMPLYIMGWRREAEELTINMMEDVEFSKGWQNVPSTLKLEIQSRNLMQFYSVSVRLVAKFSGLRWIMYSHRILSFWIFASAFFTVALSTTFVVYIFLSTYFSPKPGLKIEPEEVMQHPIKAEEEEYKSEEESESGMLQRVKSEPVESARVSLGQIPIHERERSYSRGRSGHRFDSGLGTSVEEPDRTGSMMQRRRGRRDNDESSDGE